MAPVLDRSPGAQRRQSVAGSGSRWAALVLGGFRFALSASQGSERGFMHLLRLLPPADRFLHGAMRPYEVLTQVAQLLLELFQLLPQLVRPLLHASNGASLVCQVSRRGLHGC